MKNRHKAIIAMSGGVDSSTAAYILKEEGYDLTGISLKTTVDNLNAKSDISDAANAAKKIGIKHEILDVTSEFRHLVINPFIKTYLEGKTPNPCVSCNNLIKFGVLLHRADELGVDFVATGHYAAKAFDEDSQRWFIREGKDKAKDQSYFLFALAQQSLKRALFPLGNHTKKGVRDIAKKAGIYLHDKGESQEICFISDHYADFVRSQTNDLPGKGRVQDTNGNDLGEHEGYYQYTIGQRKGIGIAGKSVRYVIKTCAGQNLVVLGSEEELLSKNIEISDLNWMIEPKLNETYEIKIRSRNHRKSSAVLVYLCDNLARLEFIEPIKSVTPGQAAVLYRGDAVMGGGWIQ